MNYQACLFMIHTSPYKTLFICSSSIFLSKLRVFETLFQTCFETVFEACFETVFETVLSPGQTDQKSYLTF